jgi:hypothetical protein
MKRYISIAYLVTIAAGMAAAQPGPVAIVVQQYTFAPIGAASGQTMRLNLSNVANGTAVCMANLSFVNADGSSIRNQDVTVKSGQTMSFSLQTADVPSNGAEIRGLVKLNRR